MRLTKAPLHELMSVVAVETPARATRLAGMGIVVGSALKVRQRRPAVIVEYEETIVAMDVEMADEIEVEKTAS